MLLLKKLRVLTNRNLTWLSTILILLVLVLVLINVYSKEAEIEREFKKEEKILLDKIDKGIKLTSSEINSLTGIFLWQRNDKGIEILERLKDYEVYKDKRYVIYLNLSVFYAEKAKKTILIQEKKQLIDKAEEYLTFGFSGIREKALAHYLRAKRYEIIGCIEMAKTDLQEAISIAKLKDIIYFEDGIYLEKEKFIKIVKQDLNRFKMLKDDCILKEMKDLRTIGVNDLKARCQGK